MMADHATAVTVDFLLFYQNHLWQRKHCVRAGPKQSIMFSKAYPTSSALM